MVYYLPNLDLKGQEPENWDEFWEQAAQMLQFARWDFEKDLQTKDEAVGDAPGRQRDDVIRFRKSDDADQIAYFHDLGRRTVQVVEELIERREWTPLLAHHWSALMFAHGFVMPSAFALENDLAGERAGAASRERNSRERHQRWFSHYCLRAYEQHGSRFRAEDDVERLVQAILANQIGGLGGFAPDWFEAMVTKWPTKPTLTSRYRDKYLSLKRMQELAQGPTDDLPPLNLSFPHP